MMFPGCRVQTESGPESRDRARMLFLLGELQAQGAEGVSRGVSLNVL